MSYKPKSDTESPKLEEMPARQLAELAKMAEEDNTGDNVFMDELKRRIWEGNGALKALRDVFNKDNNNDFCANPAE